jgi:MatE
MSQSNSSSSSVTDYRNYINDSVDPGNSLLIATVIFCLLLLMVLPFMVWMGKRFQNHETPQSSDQENASETINGGGGGASFVQAQLNRPLEEPKENQKKKAKRRKPRSDASTDDKNTKHNMNEEVSVDNDSANDDNGSEDTGGGITVASALMNAFLLTSPHGGGIKRHNQLHAAQREEQLEKDDSVGGGDSLPNNSVLGRLSQDEVSIQDAVDAPTVSGHGRGEADPMAASTDHSGLWYFCFGSWFYPLLTIADYDYETKRLVKLGGPFVMQALLVGIMSTVRVALIGKFIGTAALSAYVVVELAVGTTDVFLLGLIDACVSLCSQAIGAGNKRLAGQYIQIATILYVLCYIPIFILWMFMIGPLFSWLGFDGADDGLTRNIGEQFTILFLFFTFIKGVNTSSHALLDVIGKENYSTAFVSGEQIAATLATLVAALQPGVSDLNLVGLLLIAVQSTALILNSILIAYNGWFDKFLDGLVGSFALLVRFHYLYFVVLPVKCLMSTS